MKTDEFIRMLSTNLEPVNANELRNTMLVALTVAVGVVGAICLGWAALNMSTDKDGEAHWGFMSIALVFTLGFSGAGARMLFRSGRPEYSQRGPLLLLGLLLLVVIGALIATLGTPNRAARSLIMDVGSWGTCLVCIPIFAAIPFGALIWGLRKAAPTHLVLTGAIAGLVAGGLAAAAVVIHQAGLSVTFAALWYGGPIALCALLGAIAGPRLLRW
jgi:hypothetical protein